MKTSGWQKIHWQSEMKSEMDRLSREKKELSEQMQEMESQLDWFRSERDEEIAKLKSEKRILQERLHDAEAKIAQLKSRKRDELKVAIASIPCHYPGFFLLLPILSDLLWSQTVHKL